MDGDFDGNYVVDFLLFNEVYDFWCEGYMGVQCCGYFDVGLVVNIQVCNLIVVQVVLIEVMQGVQCNCLGCFVVMVQKDGSINNILVFVSGGFCDCIGLVVFYGEGIVLVVYQGKQ